MRPEDRFDGRLEDFYPAEIEDISDDEARAYGTALELVPTPWCGEDFETEYGYRSSLKLDERSDSDPPMFTFGTNVRDITHLFRRSSTLTASFDD